MRPGARYMAAIRACRRAAWMCACLAAASPAWPAALVDPLHGTLGVTEQPPTPRMGNSVNDDQRVPRNYPGQPPLIPHRVDSYQVDRYFNKCLDCHARQRTAFSQAVPPSDAHYVDRAGKVLDHVSTRRYFCLQCHVPQENVPALVGNHFKGDDAALPPAPDR